MPVKFACPACNQRLSVSRRKIGSDVNCPRCRAALVVPDPAARDVLNGILDPALSISTSATTAPDPNFRLPSLGDPGEPAKRAGKRTTPREDDKVAIDHRRVSIPRWVLYVQGALIAAVAGLSFGFGYWMGRGAQPAAEEVAAAPEGDAVLIRGSARYRNERKLQTPDSDAVVVVLPKDALAGQKIDTKGLRPRDPAPTGKNGAVEGIELMDGGYARADRAGKFSLVLRPGAYWVLALSRHASRPDGQPAKPDDLELLGRYFTRPGDLVGTARYELKLRQLGANEMLEYDFGAAK
jgi:hypothetical protein